MFREQAELRQQFLRLGARFEQHQVRRRRRLVELDGRRDAAHMHLEMGLGHAAVLAGALDGTGHAVGFAERLDGDARDRPHRLHGDDVLRGDLLVVGAGIVGKIAHGRALSLAVDQLP